MQMVLFWACGQQVGGPQSKIEHVLNTVSIINISEEYVSILNQIAQLKSGIAILEGQTVLEYLSKIAKCCLINYSRATLPISFTAKSKVPFYLNTALVPTVIILEIIRHFTSQRKAPCAYPSALYIVIFPLTITAPQLVWV